MYAKIHTFKIKIQFEYSSENKKFRWENDLKWPSLPIFLFRKPLSLKKNEKRFSISYYKNCNTYTFYEFRIKNDFQNISEGQSLDLSEFKFDKVLTF